MREHATQVGVLPNELGNASGSEPGPVGPDQELAVNVGAGADTDSRNRESGGDLCGDIRGHHLEYHGKSTGLLHRERVSHQGPGALAATLDDVPAQSVLTLRGEADVAHDGDTRRNNAPDLFSAAHATLQFDRVRVGLFHKTKSSV